MERCGSCQFYNPSHAELCIRCGERLTGKRASQVRVRSEPFYTARVWLGRCWNSLSRFFSSRMPVGLPRRLPWLAGWFGFVPGLGQLYNHQYKKALFYFLIFVGLAAADTLTIKSPYSNFLLLLTLLFLFWSFNDGLSTAARLNGQWWSLRQSLAFLSYLFFMLGISFLSFQFFFSPVVKLVYVSQDVLAPGLQKGDRVLVDCVSYWFRSPRHGEVVFYDPPSYEIQGPGYVSPILGVLSHDTFVINERRSFERVMGLPGDVLERRQGAFFLNGQPLSSSYLPLAVEELPEDFSIGPVPEGKYLVLITHSNRERGFEGKCCAVKTTYPREQTCMSFEGVPRLDDPRVVTVIGWEEASLVSKKEIFGRVKLRYHPPPRRQLFP